MTEQEKHEEVSEEASAASEDRTGESQEAEPAKERAPAARRAAKKEVGRAAPAGPAKAVVAPRRARGQPILSRRRLIQVGFWTGLGAIVAGTLAGGLDMVYPGSVGGFGGKISVNPSDVPKPGGKNEMPEGRFWLVNLTQEQGGPGLLALWRKCPHLGCTVPWVPSFVWPDVTTGADKQGWFRCPCHGSTFTDAGIRVFGPAQRSMDTMDVEVADGGRIVVDTGKITPGGPDNPNRAVRI
jgi:cytochrome b6-f complex iron-sulfur subunit